MAEPIVSQFVEIARYMVASTSIDAVSERSGATNASVLMAGRPGAGDRLISVLHSDGEPR
jgi:hypothetical protein